MASPASDLREWIALLEREGELVRVSAEVDPDLEITEITDRVVKSGGPALLFENVKGSRLPLLINQFGTESADRKVAILGAMKELGPDGEAYHAGLAAPLVAAGVQFALLVGEEMAPLAKALEGRIDFEHVPAHSAAVGRLKDLIRPGDAVLVKASRVAGLERLAAVLSAEGDATPA